MTGMTRILLAVPFLLLPGTLAAQEGTIAYTHSVKLEISEEVRARFEGRLGGRAGRGELPTERVSDVVLFFNANERLMKPVPRAERAGREGPPGARGQRRGGFSERVLRSSATRGARERLVASYVHQGDAVVVESREFLGRTFLIEAEQPSFEWKLSGEQAEFLDYVVYEAKTEHDGDAIQAWFTPEIPIQGGPGPYGGLPGMILVISVNDGETQYNATAVSLTDIADDVIVRPTEGDVLTREEYETIVAEKLEEIRRTRGGLQ